ncbi:hypothetical protein D3876_13055 [Sphingomonas cavernae]|uniref:Uncharacterized protein n=1 Tax=Sphingomonas cavernae TaxID=2320861 RepID=A0A418WM38_9SPHN|nr:hypothetical protein D3876_13055 [Sphingomonas cavernae]
MDQLARRFGTIFPWLLVYLWSIPLALLLSDVLNWQYDGDLGWWVVIAYTAPVLFLAEPFGNTIPLNVLAIGYLLALCVVSWLFVRSRV